MEECVWGFCVVGGECGGRGCRRGLGVGYGVEVGGGLFVEMGG